MSAASADAAETVSDLQVFAAAEQAQRRLDKSFTSA